MGRGAAEAGASPLLSAEGAGSMLAETRAVEWSDTWAVTDAPCQDITMRRSGVGSVTGVRTLSGEASVGCWLAAAGMVKRLYTLRVTGVMTQASLPKTSGLGIGWQAPVRGWSWPRAEVVGGGQATGVVGRWAPVSG